MAFPKQIVSSSAPFDAPSNKHPFLPKDALWFYYSKVKTDAWCNLDCHFSLHWIFIRPILIWYTTICKLWGSKYWERTPLNITQPPYKDGSRCFSNASRLEGCWSLCPRAQVVGKCSVGFIRQHGIGEGQARQCLQHPRGLGSRRHPEPAHPGQPGLATSLEWKALSLSVADDTPRLSFARNILWLSIVVKKVLSKNLSRARAASRTGENRCWQRLWAPVHTLPGARYKAADPTKVFPSFWCQMGQALGAGFHPLGLLFQSPQPS